MSDDTQIQTLVADTKEKDWYKALVDDLHSQIVETEFSAAQEILSLWHAVGKQLVDHEDNFKSEGLTMTHAVDMVAQDMNRSQNSVWRAVVFYRKYPDDNFLESLPEGKNMTWTKIQKYLFPPQEANEVKTDAEGNIIEGAPEKEHRPLKPVIKLTYDKETKLYKIEMNPDDFKNIDWSDIQHSLRSHLITLD